MIRKGKVAELKYMLKNTSGEVLDEADAQEPFTYLHGAHQIIPGLEAALEGLKKGDKKAVKIPPAQAYGEINEDLKLVVDRTKFPAGMKVEEGMQFQTETEDGEMIFTVDAVNGDKITLDGNHPLAGEELHFEIEVLNIRD